MAYRDVSAAGVVVVVGWADALARGRERVAMTTPDETTATAAFVGESAEREKQKEEKRQRRAARQQEWWSRQKGKGKRGTIWWGVYRFPMKRRPRSIDTPSPTASQPANQPRVSFKKKTLF